ncbi:thrombospondin type 3 repeat-containing protein, partial [Patescibacteria group bacterium]|nr:thrombospondin type 3 repeat-containing protein [Patescibacteria group bacterium]
MNYELRNIYFYRITFLFVLAILLLPGIVFAIDTDRDGLSDGEESYYHTDPENVDTDGDGYYDGVEVEFDYSPHIGDNKRMNEYDYDGDGLNDWVERWFGS